ncbi:MAG: glycosyltransferase [Paracoccaceae bacterium]
MAGRLAVLLPDLDYGGTQANLITFANALAARSHQVDLITFGPGTALASRISPAIERLNFDGPGGGLAPLIGYLRRVRPRAVLSALTRINLMAVCARIASGTRPRLVLSIRSTLSRDIAENPKRRAFLPLIRRAYPVADAIFAVSEGAADDFSALSRIPRARIGVIYNPVVSDRIARGAAEPLDDPWAAGAGLVVGCGRLSREKDFPTLIRAVARLEDPVRLVILGEGPARAGLQAEIDRLWLADRVRLPGATPNPYAWMARAWAFALSSTGEGLPTVLIEAMACGAPVVATDCPHGPREILDGGRLAPLVPVGDPDALAKALAAALARPRPVRYPLERFEESRAVDVLEALLLGDV